jgi:hypothetical protein
MPCFDRLLGAVDQTKIDHRSTIALDLLLDNTEITAETLLKALKLRPVSLQTEARQSYTKISDTVLHFSPSTSSTYVEQPTGVA